ncbi:MAG: alanine--tRNA ligase, partial [Ignavibacteriales bacterium]|nr:alanine--tRNA ligase [Ignavibacteriales bacterium]
MNSRDIRQQFLDFFVSKKHKIVPSSPVVPFDDPTLLFTNAGMNQFKDVFLGKGTRDYTRAADTQKCIRVSGKHNDLEEVGHDTYHHTFFEMLGNWSFGDYYKEEAIVWAWELLTEIWKLPKERLWATVYKTDDESFEIWKTKTDINPNHILRFGEKDNFWEMGETGPCGPCSEIHINLTDDLENKNLVNAGTADCIEIWNLVFIQYNRDLKGHLHELPQKHVDTGMGFERLCAVLQNTPPSSDNYSTDVFSPILKKISEISNKEYNKDNKSSFQVIADHIRSLTFAIADGAVPSNEGRGYVLRRILRRAARYGRKLNLHEPFLFKLVDFLVKTMGDVFPELKNNQSTIEKIIKAEEVSFNATLDRGIELFEKLANRLIAENKKVIGGEDIFLLFDTYGFPVDLINIMAKEKEIQLDEKRFNELMNEQKEKARKSSKMKNQINEIALHSLDDFNISENVEQEFLGYDKLESISKVIGTKSDDKILYLIVDKTPFYAEGGGQIADTGEVEIDGNVLRVVNCIKVEDKFVHIIENEKQIPIRNNAEAILKVNRNRRWDVMRNHSATHFLHKALREVLGTHVQQSGSYVGPDRLRFDFTHFEKPKDEELEKIEQIINEKIRENLELNHLRGIPFDEAKKMGALMFFGDKYGEKVNVVQFGDYTLEFCGGTHVGNSSQIGMIKIVSESSIAAGMRRIEAVTGRGVEEYIKVQNEKINEEENKLFSLQE